jgi:hypothetical protein
MLFYAEAEGKKLPNLVVGILASCLLITISAAGYDRILYQLSPQWTDPVHEYTTVSQNIGL